MAPRYDTVSFLSDYGSVDEAAGVVRAVIRDLAPQVTVIDLTHEVPPFDVRGGALTLARCIQYLPGGVVLAIVDPGVGTARRAVAVEVLDGEGVLVGPDNGLLAPAVAMVGGAGRCVELTRSEHWLAAPGRTFAGRDIFAPVTAQLCNGVDLAELGEALDPVTLLPGIVALPRRIGEGVEGAEGDTGGEAIVGEVLWVDRFGNAQLNVGPDDLDGWGDTIRLRLDDSVRAARLAGTYDEIGPGIGLVVDSYGLLSISLTRRSAAADLGLAAGDPVTLEPISEEQGGMPGAAPASMPVQLRAR